MKLIQTDVMPTSGGFYSPSVENGEILFFMKFCWVGDKLWSFSKTNGWSAVGDHYTEEVSKGGLFITGIEE